MTEQRTIETVADPDDWGGCQSCGKLLDRSAIGYDDIVSAPYVTQDGDVYCIPCGREMDRLADEQAEAEGYDDFDPYEAAGESPFGLPGGGKSL